MSVRKHFNALFDFLFTALIVAAIFYLYTVVNRNENAFLREQVMREKINREKQEIQNKKKEYEIQRLRADSKQTAENMARELSGKIKTDEIIISIPDEALSDVPMIWEEKPKIYSREPREEDVSQIPEINTEK